MNRSTENFGLALERFTEALNWSETPATRDSAILRFELCYETAWKAAQYAAREAGLLANGPKQAFEAAFRLGWIEDETIWIGMMRARNNAVHTYNEVFARQLYAELPTFHTALTSLFQKIPD
ncbi:MAG: nucleotidyltransferase substrate binding protein [Opitutales bacterium]|nr:nucleotidyltransferase substrate binding protein [Opitutales bacterium]